MASSTSGAVGLGTGGPESGFDPEWTGVRPIGTIEGYSTGSGPVILPSTSEVLLEIWEAGSFRVGFPPGWSPSTSRKAKRDTLEAVWTGYYDRSGWSYAHLDAMITKVDAEARTTGKFWTAASGIEHRVALHALRLIAQQRAFLKDTSECSDMARIATAIDERDWDIRLSAAPHHEDTLRLDRYSAFPSLPRSYVVSSTGLTDATLKEGLLGTHVNVNHHALAVYATVVDEWLNAAHWAWQFASTSTALSAAGVALYTQQALLAGRLALGVVAYVAMILVHEFVHRFTDRLFTTLGEHCVFKCCHERVAATWFYSTTARLGLLNGALFSLSADGLSLGDNQLGDWSTGAEMGMLTFSNCLKDKDYEALPEEDKGRCGGRGGPYQCTGAIIETAGVAASGDDWRSVKNLTYGWYLPELCREFDL